MPAVSDQGFSVPRDWDEMPEVQVLARSSYKPSAALQGFLTDPNGTCDVATSPAE